MANYSLRDFTVEDKERITGIPAAEQLAKEVHHHLPTELNSSLNPRVPIYQEFIGSMGAYLGRGELANCDNIMHIWTKLTEQAKISHGKYKIIKDVFKKIKEEGLVTTVTQAEEKIEKIMKYGEEVEARGETKEVQGKVDIPDGDVQREKKPPREDDRKEVQGKVDIPDSDVQREKKPPREDSARQSSNVVKVTLRSRSMSDRIELLIKGKEAYPSTHKSRGRVVLINIYKFDDEDHFPESVKEIEALKSVFLQLGFAEKNIREENNLTAQKITECLKEEAGRNGTDIDCFICVLLSHGEKGQIYGSDCEPVSIQDITEMFDGEKCPSMVGKPKLFFVEACQGGKVDKGAVPRSEPSPRGLRVPITADVFLALSTFPDYKAWTSGGLSHFTQSLISVLADSAHKLELQSLLIKVNERTSDVDIRGGIKQMPLISHSLRRYFFFFPKVEKEPASALEY